MIFNYFQKVEIFNLNKKIEEKQHLNEYLKEQKILLLNCNINAPLITSTLKTDSLQYKIKQKEYLITFIPTEACWECVEDLIRKIAILGLKHNIRNHVLCTQTNYRNLYTLISNEKLNIEVQVSDEANEIFKKLTLNQEFLFIVNNPLKEMYFTYVGIEGEDPIDFLTKNYYDAR